MKVISKLMGLLLAVCLFAGILAGTALAADQQKGWVKVYEQNYAFWKYYNTDGTMHEGWLKDHGKWYYFLHGYGYMAPANLDLYSLTYQDADTGKLYLFNNDGVWQNTPGWNSVSTDSNTFWFYLNSDSTVTRGWKQIGGVWYYFDDNRQGQERIISSNMIQTFSFRQSGGGTMLRDCTVMLGILNGTYNEVKARSSIYSFAASGAMITNGWAYNRADLGETRGIGQGWLYHGADGKAVNGWKNINGKWYYFEDHLMKTGWVQSGGKWYLMGGFGVMLTGWQKSGGNWYYLAESGVMQTGWVKLSGKWYYLDASGIMATGTRTIGGKTYTFNNSGVWVK